MVAIIIILIIVFGVQFQIGNSLPGNSYYIGVVFIYMLLNTYYIIKIKKTTLCYEFLFSISFGICSFLTFFILDDLSEWQKRIFISDNEIIFRAYTISIIAYLFYMLGLLSQIRTQQTNKNIHGDICSMVRNERFSFRISDSLPIKSDYVVLVMLVAFLTMGGLGLLSKYNNSTAYKSNSSFILSMSFYLTATYTLSSMFHFIRIKQRKITKFNNFIKDLGGIYLVNTSLLFVIFFLSGNRSGLMQLFLPTILLYHICYRHISTKSFFLLIIIGVLALLAVGFTRQGDKLNDSYSVIELVRDFLGANAATVFFINEVDLNGITGGSNYLSQVLAVVPGLQGLVAEAFPNIFNTHGSSAVFTTSFDSESGLGTSLIGDIYYTFGLFGTIIIMFLYGRIIKFLSNKSINNIYYFAIFLVVFGNVIFSGRVELPYILRLASFTTIILFIYLKVFKGYKH